VGSSFPPAIAANRLPDLTERGVVASAVCCGCQSPISDWQERLLPVVRGELVATEQGELAMKVDNPAGCPRCGGRSAEIRVHGAEPKAAEGSG
jgi:hypothetical protein